MHSWQFAPLLVLIANLSIAGVSLWVGFQQRTKAEEAQRRAAEVQQKARAIAEVAVLGNQANVGARGAYEQLLLKRKAPDQDIAGLAGKWAESVEQGLDVYRVPDEYGGPWATFMVPYKGVSTHPREVPTAFLFDVMAQHTVDTYSRKNVMFFLAEKTNRRAEVARLARQHIRNSQYLPEIAAICGVLSQLIGKRAPFMDYQRWEVVLDDFLAGQGGP